MSHSLNVAYLAHWGVGIYVIKYFTTFFPSKFFSYFPPLKPRCVLWSDKYGNRVLLTLEFTCIHSDR